VSEQTAPDSQNRAESEAEVADRLLHGSSFGAAAAAYAEHRPGYAEDAVRWALEPVRDGQPVRVADLGAGTGKLTTTLAGLGAEVTAVEPDPQMLAELRRTMPAVRSVPGSAEAIPLPDASLDAVLAGQAMHWFAERRTGRSNPFRHCGTTSCRSVTVWTARASGWHPGLGR
jgi:SAM-dependent methyltransferase